MNNTIYTVFLILIFLSLISCNGSTTGEKKESKPLKEATETKKVKHENTKIIKNVFKAIKTGDSDAMKYYADSYKQHNLGMADGKAAVGGFFSGKPSGVTADVHFMMTEGDVVVTLSTYGGSWGQFVGSNSDQVGFDVFKMKDGQMVEHWDNLINVANPEKDTTNGNTQVNSLSKPSDRKVTDKNKAVVKTMLNDMLIGGDWAKKDTYFATTYIQHSPGVPNGTDWMKSFPAGYKYYSANKGLYAQGNYVFAMSEGYPDEKTGLKTAFYDLFKMDKGIIQEHWDTQQIIPAEKDWKNKNGKW